MPIGAQVALTPVVNLFTLIQPKRVLDVGIGTGTFGLLFREYSDIMAERYLKEEWQIRIDGVEIWDKYLTDSHRHWYNNIYITSILDFRPEIFYDMVYLGDVIEHLNKEDALLLIDKMKTWAEHIIITTPAEWYNPPHDPLGNPSEHHLSFWTPEDLPGFEIIATSPLIAHWSCNKTNE